VRTAHATLAKADYIIFVDSIEGIFKIVKKDSREVLAIVPIGGIASQVVDKHKSFYEVFTALGFKVKKTKELLASEVSATATLKGQNPFPQ
jgi:hypothetical protein